LLKKLYKVTLIKELIKILPLKHKVYSIYKLAKIRNLTRKELAKPKLKKLELVYINIARLFVKTLRGNT
jgi:hypothetical protein